MQSISGFVMYIDTDQYVYYSYVLGESTTHNHKPQLSPQHCNHHDEVRKNVIPYALGLMLSWAICWHRILIKVKSCNEEVSEICVIRMRYEI